MERRPKFWVLMTGYYFTSLAFIAAFSRYCLILYDFKYNEAVYLQKIQKYIKYYGGLFINHILENQEEYSSVL